MSNLAQFLGQYNNSGGVELLDGGVLNIAGSKISRFIALNPVTSANLNVLSADLDSYVNVDSIYTGFVFSTTTPPTRTTGVQINWPVNTPQKLTDNTVPQGLWIPFKSTGAEYVTYGKQTNLQGTTYKASVILNANCTIVASAVGNTLYLIGYNPITKVFGSASPISPASFGLASWGSNYFSPYNTVVKIFPINSNTFLIAVVSDNSTVANNYQTFGACVFTVDGSNVIIAGATNNAPASFTYTTDGGAGVPMIHTECVQLSSSLFSVIIRSGSAQIDHRMLSVSGTTISYGTLYTEPSAMQSINDVLVTSATTYVVIGRVSSGINVVGYTVSGTTITPGTTLSNFTPNDSQTSFAFKMNGSMYVVLSVMNSGSNWHFRPFTYSGSTLTALTLQTLNAPAIDPSKLPTRDYAAQRRTDAFKIRKAFSNRQAPFNVGSTYIFPRSDSGIIVSSLVGGVPVVCDINQTTGVVTTTNGTSMTTIGGLSSGDAGDVCVFYQPLDNPSKVYMCDNSTYRAGRLVIINGFNTTLVGGSDWINYAFSGAYNSFANTGAWLINDNFGFGRYKTPTGLSKIYPTIGLSNFETGITTPAQVEASLTADGSVLIASDSVPLATATKVFMISLAV